MSLLFARVLNLCKMWEYFRYLEVTFAALHEDTSLNYVIMASVYIPGTWDGGACSIWQQ
jgi:hypothetical protein